MYHADHPLFSETLGCVDLIDQQSILSISYEEALVLMLLCQIRLIFVLEDESSYLCPRQRPSFASDGIVLH